MKNEVLELILVALDEVINVELFFDFIEVCLIMGFDGFLYGKDTLFKEVLLLLS